MRSSTLLALLGASLAAAGPLAHDRLHKKAIVYDIITDIVYVTVTAGQEPVEPTVEPTTVNVQHTVVVIPEAATRHHSHSKKPSSSSIVVPPPAPTTSTTEASPAPITTEAPAPTTEAPAPTTEAPAPTVEAPAPTVEAPAPTVEAPAPAPTTTQAPVVVPTTTEAPVVKAAATPAASGLSGTGIDKHNSCRSSHSAEEVAWNATLADAAQKLADTCVWGHDLTIDGGGYGQNIASQGSSSSDAWTLESALENAIIEEWYSEASLFASQYGVESPNQSIGDFLHFTQIVWKNSLEIGCAVAKCPTSNSIFPGMYTWYTVCNYFPQGNVLGEFAENVTPS